MLRRLVPVIEHLLTAAIGGAVTLANFCFNLGAASRPSRTTAVVEIVVVGCGIGDVWNQDFLRAQRAALYDHVALGKILQKLSQSLSAVERGSDLVGVGARKLKKDVCAHGHDCGSHLRRVLLQELICGDYRDGKFSCFAKQRVESGVIGN